MSNGANKNAGGEGEDAKSFEAFLGAGGEARLGRTSDEELMRFAAEGSLRAFECLVERYKVAVFSLCHQILRSREDAEEASQDAFVKAFRARSVYDPSRKVAPWLLKIATNAARDLLRRQRVRPLQQAEEDWIVEQVPDEEQDEQLGRELDAEELHAVLEGLSPDLRLPLTLKYLHGYANPEVAEVLGLSLSSLKVRLARARGLLHSRLVRRLDP
jgi:RNA polymerase sigma-70 factor (ECF subfamily)